MERDIAIGRIIGILSNQIKRQFDSSASKTGVTGVQGRVLHYLLGQPREQEIFQKDLEEEFNLRRSSATGILQLMEKNGYIERVPVEYDARLKKIVVLPKGLEASAAVDEDIRYVESKLQDGLTEEELEIFRQAAKEDAKKSSTVEKLEKKRIILSCKGKERIAARLKIELTSENNRAILLRCKIKCRMGYKFFLFLI